jgi:hypothetical protein
VCIRAFKPCVLDELQYSKLLGYHYIQYKAYLSCSNRVIDVKSINNSQPFLLSSSLILFRVTRRFNPMGFPLVRSWAGIIERVIRMLVVPCGLAVGFVFKFYRSMITRVASGGSGVGCWLNVPSPDCACWSCSSKLVIWAIHCLTLFGNEPQSESFLHFPSFYEV